MVPGCAGAEAPTRDVPTHDVIAHPRLFATPARVAAAKVALAGDATGLAVRKAVMDAATKLLSAPVQSRDFEAKRPVMLPTSRAVLGRIQTLGIAYFLTGDARFATRGVEELLNLCGFSSWNPSHFLDVAEAGHAAAIGYDWFFAVMTAEQRGVVRTAIVEKSLGPARAEYARGTFWTKATHNWNIVCNSGVALAALAVEDDEPELARGLIARALVNVRQGFSSYHADGGWAEGPGYWQYATEYAVYLLAALESAGWALPPELVEQPGYARTAGFIADMTGPSGQVFNYADSRPSVGRTPALLWLAARFGRPSFSWWELRSAGRALALDALWYAGVAPAPVVLDASYPAVAVASFRSAWGETDATWVAMKGGDNAVNHGDLDLGSFVIESGGQRFASELGPDDYALPGYFSGAQRYRYMRTASRGQNVLMRGEVDDQARGAVAPLAGYRSEPGFAAAMFDVSAAYPGMAHRRGVALIDRRHVAVVDEVRLDVPGLLTWNMLTEAQVELQGPTAVLRRGGRVLVARLVDPPEGAVFGVLDAAAPAPENPNKGFSRLVVRWPARGAQRLAVLFSPEGPEVDRGAVRRPLGDWFS